MTAEKIAEHYFQWLPRFFSSIIQVKIKNHICFFVLPLFNLKLLVLEKLNPQSDSIAQLRIVGGILAKKNQNGWLEFRVIIPGQVGIAAIHDFKPSLPWYIYRLTQAQFHLWVMNRFSHFLSFMKKDTL